MNKKIYKRVGLLSISALAALSLAVPVRAGTKAEQSCTEYTNYYFFSEINHKSNFENKTKEIVTTGVKYKALPEKALNIKGGKICLGEDKTDCDVFKEEWKLEDFYKEVQERLKDDNCENGCLQKDKGNVMYFGGADWYTIKDGVAGDAITEGQNYNKHDIKDLIKGTIQPTTTIKRAKVDNSDEDEFQITRTHIITTIITTDGTTTTIDGNANSFKHAWSNGTEESDTVLAPALYKVVYELCQYKAEIDYINKDTKEEVHEPYKKDDLSNGDKDSVDSPKVDGCTLVDKNDSTVDYTIDNTDYQKTVYYTCKAENPAVNPKTGNALIFVAWVVGLSSLGYSIYWFKKNKKEEV